MIPLTRLLEVRVKSLKPRTLAALFAVLLLVAASCGSDDGADLGASDRPTRVEGAFSYTVDFEPSTRGITDETVRIGAMTQATQFAGFEQGVRARIERANRDGELPGGRKLELVQFVDDSSDPLANFEGARTMVQNDEVFALVMTSTVALPQTTDYLAENQVPFIGWGFMPGFCAPNHWGFGFNGCLLGSEFELPGAEPLASVQGTWFDYFGTEDFTVGYFNTDEDAGRDADARNRIVWGDQMVFSEFVPTAGSGGITDPTRYVNTVLRVDPDVVVNSTDYSAAIRLKAAIAASGWDGLVADYVTYVPGLPQSSPDLAQALEGGLAITRVPPLDPSAPAIAQLMADFEAIGAIPLFGAMVSYWSTDLLVQMLVAAGEDFDTASFYKTVNIDGFESVQAPGGMGPVRFPADHVLSSDCAALVQVVDGEFEVAYPFTCYGDPDR